MTQSNTEELALNLVEIMWRFGPQGMDKQCCENLSMAEYKAMVAITTIRSCSVQDVGKQLGFTKSGATRIVNRLEKKGFITKEKWKEDNRICCLIPTPVGKTTLKNASTLFMESIETVIRAMPKEQRDNLADSLGAMARAIKLTA